MKKIFFLLFFLSILLNGEFLRNVTVENRTYTDKMFIMKQTTFFKDTIIDFKDIEESKYNIFETKLFGEIDFKILKVDSGLVETIAPESLNEKNLHDTVDVGIVTKEILVFLPSFGFSITKPYSVTLGASYGNLFKQRHIVDLCFTFLDVREIFFTYSIPSVYSRKYTAEFKTFYSQKNRDIIEIVEFHKGFNLKYGYSIFKDFLPQIIFGFDRISFKDDTISLSYSYKDQKGYDEFLETGFEVVIDKKNSPFFPTSGSYLKLNYLFQKNFWGTPVDRVRLDYNSINFLKFFEGTIALRNKILLQKGTLAYYNLVEPDDFENRAVPEKIITANNRYSGTVELRYPFLRIPFKCPILGRINFNYLFTFFFDWTTVSENYNELRLFDKDGYHYGFGAGIMFFTEIFNPVGVQIGFSPKDGIDQFYKKLKYNIFIFSWNF